MARLLASFPDLLALMGTDAATIRDFLADYRERNARDELLLALDASGAVVARSDTFAALALPDVGARWLEPALSGQPVYGLLDDRGPAASPGARAGRSRRHRLRLRRRGRAGGRPLGRGAAGRQRPRDRRADAGRGGRHHADARPRAVADRRPTCRPAASVLEVELGGERFEAVTVADPHAPALGVVALQSLDLALAPYRNIQRGLVLLGLLAAALGIGAGALLARSITAPMAALSAATEEVARGRFDVKLDVPGQDELARLAAGLQPDDRRACASAPTCRSSCRSRRWR